MDSPRIPLRIFAAQTIAPYLHVCIWFCAQWCGVTIEVIGKENTQIKLHKLTDTYYGLLKGQICCLKLRIKDST